MTILHDDGVYRHIRFDKPKEQGFNEPFHLITWPWRLTVAGGHGTYTFARDEDMFEFFKVRSWSINPHYWGEKLEAIDKHAGFQEHDLWETNWEDYTSHYLWSLQAIVWGNPPVPNRESDPPRRGERTHPEPHPMN